MIDNLGIGGAEFHLLRLIRDLDRARINPSLALLDGEGESSRQWEPENCEIIRLGIRSFLRPSVVAKATQFVQFLRRYKIDILQMYFPNSTFFGAICGKVAGVPNLIRTRRHSGYGMTRSYQLKGRIATYFVSMTIANSESSKQSVIEQEAANEMSVIVIPNGVDLCQFVPGSADGLRDRSQIKRIGMVANLRPVKRIEDFIAAAAIMTKRRTDCVFEVAGEGPLRGALHAAIAKRGMEKYVKLIGSITDVPAFLRQLDVFVSCSLSEGQSNSILQAMACGLPVVATDIAANQSLVQHQSTGLLYPVGETEELANYIFQLLDDQSLAQQIGRTAREVVERQFEQSLIVRRYEEVFIQLAVSRSPA